MMGLRRGGGRQKFFLYGKKSQSYQGTKALVTWGQETLSMRYGIGQNCRSNHDICKQVRQNIRGTYKVGLPVYITSGERKC